MTDGTTDEPAGDGMLDIAPDADELFGDIADEPRVDVDRPSTEDSEPSDVIEDRTASDVFAQFRVEADGEFDADDVLEDESPEDIIAAADDERVEERAGDLVDEDGLEDLLLTGRTEGEEFLWIDTGGSGSDDPDSDGAVDDGTGSSGDEVESEADDLDRDRAPPLEPDEEGATPDRDEERPSDDDGEPVGRFARLRAKLGSLL